MLVCGSSNDETIAVELARLFAGYPAQKTDGVSSELRMEAYFEALSGVPAWIVSEVRLATLHDKLGGDPRFAPTPTQFGAPCRDRMRRISEEIAELRRIERATPGYEDPAPEVKARVSEGFKALRRTLGSNSDEITGDKARETLLAKCEEMGIPVSALDAIPDAPERTGTFRRASAPLKRGEAA